MAPTLPKKLLQHRPEAGDFDPQGRVAAGQHYVRRAQGNLLATQDKASQNMISTVGETAIGWVDSQQKAKYQQITDDLLNVTNRPDIASPKKYKTKSEEINAARKQYREQAEELFSQGRFRDPGAIIPTHEDILRKAGTSYAQQIGIEAKLAESKISLDAKLDWLQADTTAQLINKPPPANLGAVLMNEDGTPNKEAIEQLTQMNPAAATVINNSLAATYAEWANYGRRLADSELRQLRSNLNHQRTMLQEEIYGLTAEASVTVLKEALDRYKSGTETIPPMFISEVSQIAISDTLLDVNREIVQWKRESVWQQLKFKDKGFRNDPTNKFPTIDQMVQHTLDLIGIFKKFPAPRPKDKEAFAEFLAPSREETLEKIFTTYPELLYAMKKLTNKKLAGRPLTPLEEVLLQQEIGELAIEQYQAIRKSREQGSKK